MKKLTMRLHNLHINITLVLLSVLLSLRCSSDDTPPIIENTKAATSIQVVDIRNAGDASDLNISFLLGSGVVPDEIRLFVVKQSKLSEVDLEFALNLSPESFKKVDVNGSSYQVELDAQFVDTDLALLSENTSYVLSVLSISENNEVENSLTQSHAFDIAETDIMTTLAKNIPIGTGGVSIGADGNIYLSDFGITLNGGGDKIYKVTPDGETSVFATGLNGAAGSDFDDDGNLYQSNITGNTISLVSPEGVVSTFISANTQLRNPVGLIHEKVSDTEFNLYVTSCGGNTILKIDQDKNIIELASGSLFSCPNGITKDEEGNLYVTNFNNANIIKITPEGNTTIFKTLPGGQNTHPVYFGGKIYVVARGALGIYEVDLASGQETLIAGNGAKGIRDGQALKAQFSRPNDIDITPDGKTLYINDSPPEANARSEIGPVYLRKIAIK